MERYIPEPKHIKDDFYAVEATGWVPVNEKGEVLLPDDSITLGTYNKFWQYYQCGGLSVHRIMAFTFLECPGDPKEHQVNHKDGDKLNNLLDNLEWMTVSENAIHAYKTGLRPDNKPVSVKNLETGKIMEFYSLQECARHFGVNGSLISLYLKNDTSPRAPWRNQWSIIFTGNEWPVIDRKLIKGYAKPVIAIPVSEEYGKHPIIFASASAAANQFLVNPATLSWYLNGKGSKQSNTYIGYRWYYLDSYQGDTEKGVVIEAPKPVAKCARRKPRKLHQRDLTTGEVTVWESIWDLAESMGWKKNSVEKAIWRNQGVFRGKEYSYIG